MNNYDQLKASTKKDKDTVVSLHVPKEESKVIKLRKPTFFSILLSALKADNFKVKTEVTAERKYVVPVPKYTIVTFLFLCAILVALTVMSTFVDMLVMIPLTLIFAVLAIPSIFLVFFVEFNTRKTISLFNIILMVLIGIFSYALITTICNEFLTTFIYKSYIDTCARPVAWTLITYLLVSVTCNVLRVCKLPECLLISLSFSIGYVICQSLLDGFSMLFVDEQINIINRPDVYSIELIINESEDLKRSFSNMLSGWFENYLYYPVLTLSLSVLVASVVSYKERSKAEKRPMVKSMYLLLFISVFFNGLGVVQTNFFQFDIIIKLFSILATIYLAIRMINYCLLKECN